MSTLVTHFDGYWFTGFPNGAGTAV